MGKQSSRMIYRGKDHKDIYFSGHYHNAMYKGSRLVWRKLYDRYCSFNADRVVELDDREIIIGDESVYTYTAIQHNDNYSIATFRVKETRECFTAFSSDLMKWKRVRELDGVIDDDHYMTTVYTANFNGFWVYQLYHEFVYYIEIDDYDNSYTVTEAEIPKVVLLPYQSSGISNNFYAVHKEKTDKNMLYIAKKNGEVEVKQLGHPFDRNTAPDPNMLFANIDDHLYIVTDYETTYTNRTYLFHISNLDTDTITIAYDSYRSDYFGNAKIGIDIIYSGSGQILLLFHNGIEKIEYEGTISHTDWYDNMEFYKIGPSGNLEFVLQKEENKDLVIPLYGSNKHDTFKLRLLRDKYITPSQINPIDEGTAYYSQLRKISASDYGNINTSLEIVEGYRNFECIIGKYENSDGILVVYIDNLFFEESDGNFAFIIKK